MFLLLHVQCPYVSDIGCIYRIWEVRKCVSLEYFIHLLLILVWKKLLFGDAVFH